MIYGGGGDLKCPAKSNQNNGLEVYSKFFQTVAEFKGLESLPTSVKFSEEHDATFQPHLQWYCQRSNSY